MAGGTIEQHQAPFGRGDGHKPHFFVGSYCKGSYRIFL